LKKEEELSKGGRALRDSNVLEGKRSNNFSPGFGSRKGRNDEVKWGITVLVYWAGGVVKT